MDEVILKTELEGVRRYFNALSVFGYKSYDDVNRMLVMSMIEELFTSEFSYFITEDDYRTLINSLYCLLGNNCLYDFPSYATWDSMIHKDNRFMVYRISENDILRNSENDYFRVEI